MNNCVTRVINYDHEARDAVSRKRDTATCEYMVAIFTERIGTCRRRVLSRLQRRGTYVEYVSIQHKPTYHLGVAATGFQTRSLGIRENHSDVTLSPIFERFAAYRNNGAETSHLSSQSIGSVDKGTSAAV